MTIVTTLSELKKAKKNGDKEIIVQGKLANTLKKASKVGKLSKVGLATLASVLGVSAITAPVTGGLSMGLTATVATLTGLEIAAIIAASTLGFALILALFKDYEEIECSNEKIILRRKKNNS